MPKYGVVFDAFATTTSFTTAAQLNPNASGERGEVVELIMTGSGSAAAADRQHRAALSFCTFATTGAGQTPTPEPFSQGSAAADILAAVEMTTEATVVATAFIQWGFNQRGGMRWAVPRGEGVEINNADSEPGVVFRVLSDAAGSVDGHIHWWEP